MVGPVRMEMTRERSSGASQKQSVCYYPEGDKSPVTVSSVAAANLEGGKHGPLRLQL